MNNNHAYYGLAQQMYPRVVDRLVQRNEITTDEANFLLQQIGGPSFENFVAYMIRTFPSLAGEQQMEQQLYYKLIQPIYNDMRMRAGGGGYGYRYGGAPVPPQPPPGYGPGGYYRGPGGYQPPTDRGSTWYAGAPRAPQTPYRRPGTGGYYQTPPPPPRDDRRREEPRKHEEPKKIPWKAPEILPESKVNKTFENGTAFAVEKFVGFDDATITNAFVVDLRPRFTDDFDVIKAYRNVLDAEGGRQFLTVCYNKMVVLRTDRGAFKNLVKAVSNAVSNIASDNVKDRIRTILSISKDHTADAKEAYEKLILDEFNYHVLCGELTDSAESHITWTVTANSLQGLFNLLSGDIDKETRDTLHQIKNFDSRLTTIVSRVIDTVVLNADKRIFDPISDKTIMDIYGRAVPPIWRNNRENVWESTENFFTKYLASIKTVNGAQPQAAVVASQTLHSKLTTVDHNYAVISVPRIITWTNDTVVNTVGFKDDGSIAPALFGGNRNVDNDIAYFANTVFKRTSDSKLTAFAVVPHSLLSEGKGVMTRLNYGITSDGAMYVGPGSF